MNHAIVRFVSRLLIACVACLPLQSQAGLIGTNQAVSDLQAQSARASLAAKLEGYGVAGEQARARVAALTDAEVASLVERVSEAPAGANPAFGILFVLGFLVWRFVISDQAQAESGKKKQQ